jgi:hypothetical protein
MKTGWDKTLEHFDPSSWQHQRYGLFLPLQMEIVGREVFSPMHFSYVSIFV